jgi:hypothetical protein
MKKEDKTETIIGYVGETEDDDVVRLTILTDEEDYVVEMNKQGRKLLQELDSEIEATGVIKRNRDGSNIISITKFQVIDDAYEDEDEYDDDEDDDDYDDGDDEDDMDDRDDWME